MIVPGTQRHIDHPFSWYADVEHKTTGKKTTLWMNGDQLTRELVADHVARHYPNAIVKRINPCESAPIGVLRPVPPDLYEFGLRAAFEKLVMPAKRVVGSMLFNRQPISRKPLY